jgi:hypothetical protein
MKFRKKPVVIEAWKFPALETEDITFSENNMPPEWFRETFGKKVIPFRSRGSDYLHLKIVTPEGFMVASPLDWIIKGINGELYSCKPDIFEKTYEPVEEGD